MGRILIVVLVLCLAAGGPGFAEGLPAAVPDKLVKRLVSGPQRVIEQAGDLIHGHGAGGGIDAAGLARSVAMDRAAVRARALVPLVMADLDADGQVTAAEMAAVIAAADAGFRGRLVRARDGADADGNGIVTRDEMFGDATAQARNRIDAEDEARVMALMTLDLDGDGRLTLPEVTEAAARARVSAARARTVRPDEDA